MRHLADVEVVDKRIHVELCFDVCALTGKVGEMSKAAGIWGTYYIIASAKVGGQAIEEESEQIAAHEKVSGPSAFQLKQNQSASEYLL